MCVRGRVYMREQCEYRRSNVFNKYSYQIIVGSLVVAVAVTASYQ